MKKLSFVKSLLLILPIVIGSCERHKHFEERSIDGKVLLYSYYEDSEGRIDGASIENYPSGSPKRRGNYVHGERDGLYEHYHDNGKLFVQSRYQLGALMDVLVYQDTAGFPLEVGSFHGGNGILNLYHTEGKLSGYCNLKNGWYDGYYYILMRGRVVDSIKYVNGFTDNLPGRSTETW